MTEKCVNFYSVNKISCPDCLPADAILCLPSELTISELGFISVTVENRSVVNQACGPINQYLIKYDDADLVEGTILTSSYIEGVFCKDCLTDWK